MQLPGLQLKEASIEKLLAEAVALLSRLIAIPSFSKEESQAADLVEQYFSTQGIAANRSGNNVWAKNKYFSEDKPTILLNSHIDTVKPNSGYTRDPFAAEVIDGKLYGLGSNDAGGPLVSLLQVFMHYYAEENLAYNLIFAATAEEEISGHEGIASILPELPEISFAIVGEPTGMQIAVAEKGLLVLDCIAHGKAGHAARDEGDNALYKAIKDITWFQSYRFPKSSPWLGEVKMSVTIIQAGAQHNVVPAECKFTVDIRTTEMYGYDELLDIIRSHISSEVVPRSLRLKPSFADTNYPFIQAAEKQGIPFYGSPTLSDQALMPFPSIKMGPGESARSHTADEFIYISEIEEGIATYIHLFNQILFA